MRHFDVRAVPEFIAEAIRANDGTGMHRDEVADFDAGFSESMNQLQFRFELMSLHPDVSRHQDVFLSIVGEKQRLRLIARERNGVIKDLAIGFQ